MSSHSKPTGMIGTRPLLGLALRKRVTQFLHPEESADYQSWRQRFLWERLSLTLWLSIPCLLTFTLASSISQVIELPPFDGPIPIPYSARMIGQGITLLSIVACLLVHRYGLGRSHPGVSFLWLSWSATVVCQVVATLSRVAFPDLPGWSLVFLAQATLMPVRWRLHLTSQVAVLLYFLGVNTTLGLKVPDGQPVWQSPFLWSWTFWVCFICNLGVYLYERLKRTEFEAQREMQMFLHAVTHDLRSPVTGTTMVLQNLLQKAVDGKVTVDAFILERLLQGSDRQLAIINSLLEAHETDIQGIVLNSCPIQLHRLVDGVVAELEPILHRNQIQFENHISPALPLVMVDPMQIGRVLSNLIGNAIKHNPHGITIRLEAEPITTTPFSAAQFLRKVASTALPPARAVVVPPSVPMLRCEVIDTGIGIPDAQRDRLFELYSRGKCARYMPGLGLGLYLCREIIHAHGGQVGVISKPGEGARFWFTLPLAGVDQTRSSP